MESIGSKL